jgi:hypothetical protein
MRRARSYRRWIGIVLATLPLCSGVSAADTLNLNLQLTSSSSLNAGVVPGRTYRFVYSGAVTGSLTGEFTRVLNLEPESLWWPAAEAEWDTLYLTTPRGTLTFSLSSSRFTRLEASDAAPWMGTGTWTLAGGTGAFSGATGKGTLPLTAHTNPAAASNALTETVAGTITIDAAPPAITLNRGSTRTPLYGPNGRAAVEIEVTDATPSSGLRLVEVRGSGAAVVTVNEAAIAAAPLPYRYEFLPGTAVKKWTVLVEANPGATAPEVQVAIADWSGNTATK